ncbi:hypothetical protein Dimus_004837 [Dionaea muscipula]
MLRAKQICNLSGSARSLLYSGSRCSTADGSSSCSCPEDEKTVPRRKHRDDLLLQPRSSTLISAPSARVVVDSPIPADVTKVAGFHKSDNADHRAPSLAKVAYAPGSFAGSNSVTCAHAEETITTSSPPITDQLVKAGIAAVGFFSDLVNYKLPTSDGTAKSNSIQHMVGVGAGIPHAANIRSSDVRTVKKESSNSNPALEKSSSETGSTTGLYPHVNYQSPKGINNNLGSGKGLNHASSTKIGNSVDHQGGGVYSGKNNYIQQKSTSQRSHHRSSHSNSDVQSTEETDISHGVSRFLNQVQPPRYSKVQTGNAPAGRQFASSGYIVDSVLDVLRRLKWGPAAEVSLKNLNFSVDAYQANQVLKQIQDYSVALGFFNWLKRQAGFKHDGHTYTTMVGILGRARQFDAINNLLDQMIRDGCHPNVVTYNRLIHSYGRANYLNQAVNVFHQMQEAGCRPDRVTYCTLIDIHAKGGFLDVAMYMYQRMQEAGLSPDTFTYSVMINCLGKAGHLASAHRLFCEMVDQGCVPNLVTYNTMIALQAKARNYPVALRIYRDMQNAGYEPDKVTYSIVMEVLGHCGYVEEAEAVFSEMKSKHWVPDEPVYGLLVDLWGKVGNAQKAFGWYQAMLDAGLLPNVPTCNSLLSAFLRVHRLADAYNLLQGMLQMGLAPSLQTYTLLLSCCTEAKSSFDMGFCHQLMGITGHPAHAFLLSLPAAGPDGQNVRDHVGRFLDRMHSEDRESKRGLVDAVVDFLHKSGLKEEAGSFWEVAAEKNVYPDAVREKSRCYWLINLHVMSDGTAVTALSRTLAWFRRQLLVSGIGPSRIDIVTGWGRRSRVTGSSLVRQAVQELLDTFSFPFFTENGNTGCFVGCGEPLNRWLLQSYVERMHLL